MAVDESRETLTLKAKLAEQAERFGDMVEYMKAIVENHGESGLTEEERNLLSVAYKNVIGSRRTAWRVYNAKCLSEEDENRQELCKKLKRGIEEDIARQCDEIILLLDKHLIKSEKNDKQAQVFFLKMKGDYNRYKVEICEPGTKTETEARDASFEAYKHACAEADAALLSTNPIRLGLALNFSVFYYEIMKDSTKACEMAKAAFDNAIADLEDVSQDDYKDSTLIMQLLRDNLTLWKSETEEDQETVEDIE